MSAEISGLVIESPVSELILVDEAALPVVWMDALVRVMPSILTVLLKLTLDGGLPSPDPAVLVLWILAEVFAPKLPAKMRRIPAPMLLDFLSSLSTSLSPSSLRPIGVGARFLGALNATGPEFLRDMENRPAASDAGVECCRCKVSLLGVPPSIGNREGGGIRLALSEILLGLLGSSFGLASSLELLLFNESSPLFHISRASTAYFLRSSATPPIVLSGSLKAPVSGSMKRSSIVSPSIRSSFGLLLVLLPPGGVICRMSSRVASGPARYRPTAELGTLVFRPLTFEVRRSGEPVMLFSGSSAMKSFSLVLS